MPNVSGTLAGSLILQRALALVFTTRPVLRSMALDFRDLDSGSSESKWNQTVISRTRGIPAVNDFGTGAVDTADLDVPVTINRFKEVRYSFTPVQYSATDRDLIDEHAEPMAVALGNHIIDAVAANWTAANFTRPATVKAAGWDYEHLTSVRQTLIEAGVPEGFQKFYVGNASVYRAFLNDTLIVAGLNNPANGLAIQNGRLPVVAGFGIQEYPSLPAAGNLVGFAGTPDSVVYASRVPKSPEEVLPGAKFPGLLSVITEPRTGFSVMVNQWIDAETLNANTRLVWMYGTAVGNANNGQRIVSA